MNLFKTHELELPPMRMIRQLFEVPSAVDITVEIENEWDRIREAIAFPDGKDIAIGVGSRGIANLTAVVRAVVEKIKAAGYAPFITPAMGSHGGATAIGQIEVLAARGITEASVGAPIRATMDVIPKGEVNGIPIFLDKFAHQAAGLVDKIDFEATAINALTSCGPEDVRVPLAFDSDREALAAVLMTLRPHTIDDVRIVHIQNTLELTQLLVSKGCLPELAHKPGIQIEKDDVDLVFDKNDNLVSPVYSII